MRIEEDTTNTWLGSTGGRLEADMVGLFGCDSLAGEIQSSNRVGD